MKGIALSVALVVLLAAPASALDHWSVQSFRDEWDEASQLYYVTGVRDVINLRAVAFSENKSLPEHWMQRCFLQTTNGQMLVATRKYIEDHPEEWQEALVYVVMRAIGDLCKKVTPEEFPR